VSPGKLLLAVMAATVLWMLAFSGFVNAAQVAQPARSRVTIESWPGGLFGYVRSQKGQACAKNRVVELVEQRGGARNPRTDKRVGTALAHRTNGAYQWSSRSRGSGRVYAVARRTARCRVASSKTVRFAPRGSDVPACPSEGNVCKFFKMHIDIDVYCPSFSRSYGACGGSSNGGPAPWSPAFGVFVWVEDPNLGGRRALYYVAKTSVVGSTKAVLTGSSPSSDSANYTVTRAADAGQPGVVWYTPDLPGAGAGQQGGPLRLNFQNGIIGADVYIDGYLFRKLF
jgi:hypothetical protein